MAVPPPHLVLGGTCPPPSPNGQYAPSDTVPLLLCMNLKFMLVSKRVVNF